MRLKQIRLAGFKSFVDPTSFEVPGQLVGVVGPNGCGKSNIIDAVRWVLGESRASELRGESMQDVIFSGSSERKPASRASVELVFDNSLGRVGGQWGTFAELSVKRVLTRDGQSTYFVNNQSVRRKDVHDIFLGTGLGPRAYAIIGQGMISRIIEARPEELRIFLEEAAGVSRYKERRRETENRLSDTRENLTRVEDIRRELGSQIDRLERQAEVAQKYRDYEAERDARQRMLWMVRRDEALAEQARHAAQAAQATNQLEAGIARQRSIESELETMRAAHYAAGDELHAAQGRHYEANAEVVRLESEIRRVLESQGQLGERIASLTDQERRSREDGERAREQAREGGAQLDEAGLRAEALGQRVLELGDVLPQVEAEVLRMRGELDEARAGALRTRQAIELSAARQRVAEQARDAAERRGERLRAERSQVLAPAPQALQEMRDSLELSEHDERLSAQAQADAQTAWQDADAQRVPAQQQLREADSKLARIDARISALQQLQERAQSQARIVPWLARHGLDSLGRLWKRLRIDDGWETALESVLRERVEALEVGQLEHVAGLAADAPPAKVAFYSAQVLPPSPAQPAAGLRALADTLRSTDAALHGLLDDWLRGWYAADDIDVAMSMRSQLPPGARFITREGHAVGRLSVQMYAQEGEQEGLLARQHELDNLRLEHRAVQLMSDEARGHAVRAESSASSLAAALSAAREAHHQAVRQLSALRLDAQRLEQQAERASHTQERIAGELAEVDEARGAASMTIEEEAMAFERLDEELAGRQQLAEDLAETFRDSEAQVASRRAELREAERLAQEAAFAVREIGSRIERLQAAAGHAGQLEAQCRSEREQCEARLGELSDASARAALDEALAQRVRTEEALAGTRQRLDELTQSLKALDEQRVLAERDQEPMRALVLQAQMKEQAARLSAEQFVVQLSEAGVDEATLVDSLGGGEPPRPSWLQGEVTRLTNAIAALGAVNLAALGELDTSRERKGFLDAQSADLDDAINTLEDAIRRIDRETRDVLQQTYDSVNREFGKLFPELFGGGEARLALTGGEILDAGIQVIAQPPGKRNTSIQLLSGGEKALTAIALVFAMFQLNPAPFCLLDEVDAPLDDANTERYTDMVRRMSDQTQFLFITHNKIAMEIAQQLIGVTMQERGVSRIVAVDLDSAARLVEAT